MLCIVCVRIFTIFILTWTCGMYFNMCLFCSNQLYKWDENRRKSIHIRHIKSFLSASFAECVKGSFLKKNTFNCCWFQLLEIRICLFLYFSCAAVARGSVSFLSRLKRKSRHIKRLHCPLVADSSDGISPSSYLYVRPGRVQRYFLSFWSDWSILSQALIFFR